MASEKRKLHERLSVSLDLETVELVEKLQSKYQTSKSEIVRKALNYFDVITEEDNLSPEELRSIIKLSARPDTIVIDISIIEAIAKEVERGSAEFEKELREVGEELYREYCDMGVMSPSECLKTVEKTNLFDIATESEDSFTLISTNRKMNKILKVFLEGLLEGYGDEIEVTEAHGKIRIKTKGKSGDSEF